MAKLLFITIAGNTIGLGHLNRCLSLAEQGNHHNLSSHFLLFADPEAALRIKQAGYDCLLYPISTFNSLCVKEYLAKIDGIDAVVVDFSHPLILQQQEKIKALLSYLDEHVKNIILIDSLGEQALSTRISNLPVRTVILPYAGADLPKNGSWEYLAGIKYAILSSAYAGLKKRIINKKANRVLISCGGSDPTNLTLLALKGLEILSERINVRIIIGPLFSENLKMMLRNFAENSKHDLVLIDAPQTLILHMLWCDLAISTSGLTKYELAATATPAILISIDEFHHRVNQSFAAIGSTVDLGTEITVKLIAEQVSQLLNNYHARMEMAALAHQAVDGNGAKRIMREIVESCKITCRE